MKSTQHKPISGTDTELSRRQVLQMSGTAAGLATTGYGANRLELSPVGDAQALAPIAAVGVTVGVSIAGGAALAYLTASDVEDPPEDGDETLMYAGFETTHARYDEFEREMQSQFLSRVPENTPHGNGAWEQIRTITGKSYAEGKSQSEAIAEAQQALNEQTTRSVINTVEAWNRAMKDLMAHAITDYEQNVGVLHLHDDWYVDTYDADVESREWTVIEESESEDNHYMFWKHPVNPPINPTDLEGREEPLAEWGLAALSGFADYMNSPMMWDVQTPESGDTFYHGGTFQAKLHATHSHEDIDDIVVVDPGLYRDIVDMIETAHNDIDASLSSYIDSAYSSMDQMDSDPSDYLGPTDIINQFADSNAQTRLVAELMAAGLEVPQDAGFQAEISHPQLEADSLWGWIYPQFEDGAEVSLSAGTILAPEDYSIAYFGYYDAGDEFQTELLSGDEALEILDMSNLDGEEELTDQGGQTAGENGEVIIYTGDSPPDAIDSPEDHDGWMLSIVGADNNSQHPVSEILQDGEEYSIPNTDLQDGEDIAAIRLIPPVNYHQPFQGVDNATEVDGSELDARIETQRNLIEALDEMDDDDGLLGGGLFDDLGIFGDIQNVVIAGVAAVIALFGLGQLGN